MTSLYSRCLVCTSPFPPNTLLEHLSRGTHFAYDIRLGRLWQVCSSCRRWSLVPMESRWEALEELERFVSPESGKGSAISRPRLLAKTAHISLFGNGALEIIRVGDADLHQEALWRYGKAPGSGRFPLQGLRRFMRRRRSGRLVWRGKRDCPGCGHLFTELPISDRRILLLTPEEPDVDGEVSFSLSRRCPRCRDAHQGGLHLNGVAADFVLSRIMAFERPMGADRDRVEAAVEIVQEAGGPSALVRLLTKHGRPIGDLPPIGSVALEMLASDARERALLRLEMAGWEARWREEEELAALVDGELTPFPILDTLVERFQEDR